MKRMGRDRLGRREALRWMGAAAGGAWASRAGWGAETTLQYTGIDHVDWHMPDVARAREFYTRVFGTTVVRNKGAERTYFKVGNAYIVIDRGQPPQHIDHYAVGLKGHSLEGLRTFLGERGIAGKITPNGRDLYFTDADGVRTQLSPDYSWEGIAADTATHDAVPVQGEPIFRAMGIEHVLLNVSDPEQAAAYYAKVFGTVSMRRNNRIFFQLGKGRVGLLKTPEGARAGVNHYCVAAERFDYAEVVKKLEQLGAKIERPEIAGSPEFRDP